MAALGEEGTLGAFWNGLVRRWNRLVRRETNEEKFERILARIEEGDIEEGIDTVDLSGLNANQVIRLAQALTSERSVVHTLLLNNCEFDTAAATAVANMLRKNPNLDDFRLSDSDITQGDMDIIFDGLSKNTGLDALTLENLGITDVQAKRFVEVVLQQRARPFDLLSFPQNKITSEGALAIVEALTPDTRYLYFWDNLIGNDANINSLMDAFEKNYALLAVDLHANPIDDPEMPHLTEVNNIVLRNKGFWSTVLEPLERGHLNTLDVSQYPEPGQRILIARSLKNSRLEVLSCPACTDDLWATIGPALDGLTTLTQLNFVNHDLTDASADLIESIVRHNPSLVEVDHQSHYSQISQDHVERIDTLVQQNNNFQAMLQNLKDNKTTELDLKDWILGQDSITTIARIESIAEVLQTNKSVNSLSCEDCGLTDATIKPLLDALARRPAGVGSINFANNKLSDATAKSLIDMFKPAGAAITKLDLTGNNIDQKLLDQIAKLVRDHVVEEIVDRLQDHKAAIKTVDLSGHHFTDREIAEIGDALQTNAERSKKPVEILILNNCKLGDYSLGTLSQYLVGTKIIEVQLQNNNITDRGARILAATVTRSCFPQVIDLDGNDEIMPETIESINRGLSECPPSPSNSTSTSTTSVGGALVTATWLATAAYNNVTTKWLPSGTTPTPALPTGDLTPQPNVTTSNSNRSNGDSGFGAVEIIGAVAGTLAAIVVLLSAALCFQRRGKQRSASAPVSAAGNSSTLMSTLKSTQDSSKSRIDITFSA